MEIANVNAWESLPYKNMAAGIHPPGSPYRT